MGKETQAEFGARVRAISRLQLRGRPDDVIVLWDGMTARDLVASKGLWRLDMGPYGWTQRHGICI